MLRKKWMLVPGLVLLIAGIGVLVSPTLRHENRVPLIQASQVKRHSEIIFWDDNANIARIHVDGTTLILGNGIPADVSPDSTRILFTLHNTIHVMQRDGSNRTQLTVAHGAEIHTHPVWSPDGTRIAFHAFEPGQRAHIYLMNANGSHITRLTDEGGGAAPVWSPDGTQLAFVCQDSIDGNGDISVINADGSGQIRLTSSTARDTNPHWSPSGDQIVFESNAYQNKDIYTVTADGAELTRLTHSRGEDTNPTWSPDGQYIAFRHKPANISSLEDSLEGGDLYVIDTRGTRRTRLSHESVWLQDIDNPVWSPDGATIAFVCESREPLTPWNGGICITFTNGSGMAQLTEAGTAPLWIP